MRAETEVFRKRIQCLTYDELVEFTVSGYEKYMELKICDEKNQTIGTEIHIQYSRLSEEIAALREENRNLKELLRKEVEKNELKTRTTYGRSTEKLLSLINSAANKPEDFEDEDQDEDSEKETRIISFPGNRDREKSGDNAGRKKSDEKSGENKPPRKSKLSE